MAGERKFIRESTNRILIKEFLINGKGGSKIKEITSEIKEKFNVDNPQIEIQEAGSKASLNAQIMAEKLAEALERGWHFRRAGHSTVRRIMNSGARGCQVVIAGKLTGARHRTEKFTEGHIKYCGEVAREVMLRGFAIAKLKAGVLGVKVGIMKPDARLPDEISLKIPDVEKIEAKIEEKPVKKQKTTNIKELLKIPGIGPSIVKKFEKSGIKSLEDLYEMDAKDISSIEGIGGKTADNIIKKLGKLIKEDV